MVAQSCFVEPKASLTFIKNFTGSMIWYTKEAFDFTSLPSTVKNSCSGISERWSRKSIITGDELAVKPVSILGKYFTSPGPNCPFGCKSSECILPHRNVITVKLYKI